MNHTDDWLRHLSPPRRNHFYFGKMMGVAQFEREQRYATAQRALLNRLSVGTGILCGLEVALSTDRTRLCVRPGAALDPWGREVVVARVVEFNPFQKADPCCGGPSNEITSNGDYELCLHYRECSADQLPVTVSEDCHGAPSCDFDTTVETFALALRPLPTEPSEGFDCEAWLAPVPAEGDGEEARPPSEAEVRQRLTALLNGSCTPPNDPCIVLGRVSVTGDLPASPLTLGDITGEGRKRLYSQAELLDLIVCLAHKVTECCDQEPVEPPPSETLRVTNMAVVGLGRDDNATLPSFVVLNDRGAGPNGPIYSSGSGLDASSVPRAVRVTFTLPLELASIPYFFGSDPKSIRLTRRLQESDPETLLDVTAIPLQLDNMLVIAPVDPDGSGLQVMVSSSGFEPGLYSLTLYGTATPDTTPGIIHQPIRSADHHALDGEWPSPTVFPKPGERSGQADDGGNFEVKFEILDTLRLLAIQTAEERFGRVVDPLPVQWSVEGVQLILWFNGAVDANAVQKSLIAEVVSSGAKFSPTQVTLQGEDTQAVVRLPIGADGFPWPELPFDVRVSLAGTFGAHPTNERFDGEVPSDGVLPTGDGNPGGDCSFLLTVSALF